MRDLSKIVVILLITIALGGCGGGTSPSSPTQAEIFSHNGGDAAAAGPVATATSPASTGQLVLHLDGASKQAKPTEVRVTGLDLAGHAVYGPETWPYTPELRLTVPLELVTVRVEYLSEGELIGMAVARVSLAPGKTATVTDLAKQDMAVLVSSMEIGPAGPRLAKGTSLPLTATLHMADGTTQDATGSVTWSTDEPRVATVSTRGGTRGTVSGQGSGATVVRARLGDLDSDTSCTVTDAVLTSLTVTPAIPSLALGTTLQLTATGIFSDDSRQDLTTQVSWQGGASVSVSASGLATAMAVGADDVGVTFLGKSGSTRIAVTDALLRSITITPASPSLARGTQSSLSAIGVFSDGTTQDLTSSVLWTVQTGAVAVSSSGRLSGLSVGADTVTATRGAIQGTTGATVTDATLQVITVTPAQPSLPVGTRLQLSATGTFSDGTTQDLTDLVAWAGDSGLSVGSSVQDRGLATASADGRHTVTASLNGVSGSTVVQVTRAVVTSLQVTPVDPSIARGTTVALRAVATYSDGHTADVTTAATWSAQPNVSVADDGTVTGLDLGTADVTASFGGQGDTVTVLVTAATLVEIQLTPVAPSLPVGTTRQLTATGVFTDGTTQDLTSSASWTSSGGTVVAGLLTGTAVGDVVVTATQGGVTGRTPAHVVAAVLESIQVTPSAPSAPSGTRVQLTAIGTYSDGSTADITSQAAWSVDAHASVDARGRADATSVGTATFTASLNGRSGSASVAVTAAVLTEVQVTPPVPVVALGFSQPLTATGVYSDGTTQDLTSTASWSANAPVGTFTATQTGTATVTATVSGISGSAVVHVSDASLQSISVTPANPTAALSTQVRMVATGTFSDGTTADISSVVTWSATAEATVSNAAGQRGLATATAVGAATITATRGAVSGSTTLTVTPASLVSIQVGPYVPALAVGQSVQLTATGAFSDGTSQDLTGSVSWSASSHASVSAGGLVTATSIGQANVTASLAGVSGTTPVHVTSATLTALAVTPATPSAAKGLTIAFTATGTFSDGSTRDLTSQVTWTATANAAVSNVAPARGVATALSPGAATVTATLGGITGSATLTVGSATVSSIAVTPWANSIVKGSTRAFSAVATFTDGSVLDVTATASWSSSAAAVATVSAAGVATGAGAGSADIRATFGGVQGSAPLAVVDATVSSIAVSPQDVQMGIGSKTQLVATATYSDGSTGDVTSTVTWSSSSADAAVSNASPTNGLLTGVGQSGPHTITATLNGVSGTTQATIYSADLLKLNVLPAQPVLAKGGNVTMTAVGELSDGTTMDLSFAIAWSSSTPSRASINAYGLVTASSTNVGSTTITANYFGTIGTTVLNVTDPTLTAITITPASPTVNVGTTRQLIATGTYSDGVSRDITSRVTWSSGNGAQAVVSNAAGSKGLATGLAVGTPTISATLYGVTGSRALAVSAATLVSVSVTPFQPTIAKGLTQPMTATATYSDGTTADVTGTATWTASGAAATVSNVSGSKGLASWAAIGNATITATQGGVSGSMVVATTDAQLVSIAVTGGGGGPPDVPKNASRQLVATGTYTDGTTVNLTSACTWSSGTPSVITVSTTSPTRGFASAVGLGSSLVSATFQGITGSATSAVSENTDLIDVAVGETQAGNNSSAAPRISGDGSRIVYHSSATDLVAGDTNNVEDVFVRTGVGTAGASTVRVSVADTSLGNAEADNSSYDCAISQNGDFVVFASFASNLTSGFLGVSGNSQHIFRRQLSTQTTVLVDENRNTSSQESSTFPAVSADGRYVTFRTGNATLYGGSINQVHVVRRDMSNSTYALVDTLFNSLNISSNPSISDDGRWICYETYGSLGNLGFTDNTSQMDIVLRDMTGGSQLVSHTSSSQTTAASGTGSFPVGSTNADISGDGRYVVYQSDAIDVVSGDTNARTDVFRYDRTTGTNIRVSVPDPTTGATQADGSSTNPRVSRDGRYVIFLSDATNLVTGDTNGAFDVFVHDCTSGATKRVSVDPVGRECNGSNFTPDISDDGLLVTFMTRAPNLDTRIQNAFDHIIKAIHPPPQP